MERLSTSTSQRHPLTPLGLIDGACEHPHTTDFSICRTPWKQTSMHAHAPLRCARVHASSLWVARAYGPSYTSKDCASEHSYTLETSNKSRFRNSKKHAFAFDDVELYVRCSQAPYVNCTTHAALPCLRRPRLAQPNTSSQQPVAGRKQAVSAALKIPSVLVLTSTVMAAA